MQMHALSPLALSLSLAACAAAAPTPVCPDGGTSPSATQAAAATGQAAPAARDAATTGAATAAKFAFQEAPGLTLLPGCTATPSEGGSAPGKRAMAAEAVAAGLTDAGLAAFRAELRKGAKVLFLPIAAAAAGGFRLDARRPGWGGGLTYDGGPLLDGLVAGTGRSADGVVVRFGASAGFAYTTAPVAGQFGAATDRTVSNVRAAPGTCAPPATSEGGVFATADLYLEVPGGARSACVEGEARGVSTAHGAFVRRDLPGTPYTLVVATARKGEEAAFIDDLSAAPIAAALRAPVADGGFRVCFPLVRGTTTTTLTLSPVGGLNDRPARPGTERAAVQAQYAIAAGPSKPKPAPDFPSGPVSSLLPEDVPLHGSDAVFGTGLESVGDAYLFVVTRATGRVEAALAARK